MVKVTKSRVFRGLPKLKSKKSKISVLAILIIILIIVASVAAFLFFTDSDFSGGLICKKNYFLSTSSPYGLFESANKVDSGNKKPVPPKNPAKGNYGDQKVPILTYHYIEPIPPFTSLPNLYEDPEIFENQLSVLKNNSYNSILIRDLGNALNRKSPIPDKSIALTFDDGYEDFYTKAFPLLKKYNMKGTLYVIVNSMDKPGYITSAQAKEMAHSGYVEIGSHTMDHANLKKASDQESYDQLYESKKKLSEVIGMPVQDFAYPFGFFSARDMGVASRVGYLTAASTYPGTMQRYGNRFTLFRLRPNDRVDADFLSWLEEQTR